MVLSDAAISRNRTDAGTGWEVRCPGGIQRDQRIRQGGYLWPSGLAPSGKAALVVEHIAMLDGGRTGPQQAGAALCDRADVPKAVPRPRGHFGPLSLSHGL